MNEIKIHYRDIAIAPDGKYHLLDQKALYSKRFIQVLSFHAPGLAAVQDKAGAYHIDVNGSPVYAEKFDKAYGFYEKKAAVEVRQTAFHITPSGNPLYTHTFSWCGNFQEGLCVVRDKNNFYFHINPHGNNIYKSTFSYVGDFKNGIAVAWSKNGKCTHINIKAQPIHKKYFDDLDVYHKGFARAKDANGWFHIDTKGQPIYEERYASIEPYYNDIAKVSTYEDDVLLIDTKGQIVKYIRRNNNQQALINELSSEMVGFWKVWTIRTAVQFKLFNALPNTQYDLAKKTKMDETILGRLLKALWELALIEPKEGLWHLTAKGAMLVDASNLFMGHAASMWSEVNSAWKNLSTLLQSPPMKRFDSFKENTKDTELIQHALKALDGYTAVDFKEITGVLDLSHVQKLLAIGRSSVFILSRFLQKYPQLFAYYMGNNFTLYNIESLKKYQDHFKSIKGTLLQPFSEQVDVILLPRYIHYWPDKEALQIMQSAKRSLANNGRIYIFEMLLDPSSPNGGLFDLNMFVETGGQVRTLLQWKELLEKSQLKLINILQIKPHLSMLEVIPS